MSTQQMSARNWFDQGGSAYSRFRPEYPPELSAHLASLVESTDFAIDVGCGNGQLTKQLADHFKSVLGTDSSPDQIANTVATSNVRYLCSPAENLPLPDNCADLITAAQAAHWFDLAVFYSEVHRVAKKQAVIALISYGVMKLDPNIDQRFQKFYWDEIGPYWPPERKLVDNGYADLEFPFEEIAPPALHIYRNWNLEQLLGYISTWSSIRGAKESGQTVVLEKFADDLRTLWGNAEQERAVLWPINMRLGKI